MAKHNLHHQAQITVLALHSSSVTIIVRTDVTVTTSCTANMKLAVLLVSKSGMSSQVQTVSCPILTKCKHQLFCMGCVMKLTPLPSLLLE